MAELVCERYAEALFGVAVESGAESEIAECMTALEKLFSQNPEYVKLMSSPIVNKEEKQQAIDALLNGNVNEYVVNFCKLLADNGRFNRFSDITKEYLRLFDEKEKILRVEAVTAFPLSKQQSERLEQKLSAKLNKKVILTTTIDKAVLGGIKLRYNQSEIDATVRSRLSEMKKQIKEASVDAL